MARRKFTLEDKIKIIEELNNGLTHAQVCKKCELTSSTLSTFKRQLDVINATQPKDYQASAKEKALEEENRKLKELIGKKELELDMLQDLLKKEVPKVDEKVALAKEYTQKGIKTSRDCKLPQISRLAFYSKKEAIKNEDGSKDKAGRPIPGFSYGINNCIVTILLSKLSYTKHVKDFLSMVTRKSLKFFDGIMDCK